MFSSFMFSLDLKRNPKIVEKAPVFGDQVHLTEEVEHWLEGNCKGFYDYHRGEMTVGLLFKRKEDAAMFKLFWL
jgi:hypothetical protein